MTTKTSRRAKAPKPVDVAAFLRALKHRRKDEVEQLRALILAAVPGLTETIKWNAPSFCFAGDDRVTFRLQPGDRVQLVFHRGAKVRADKERPKVVDEAGLLEWAAPDRAIITFNDMADVKAKAEALAKVVQSWIEATRDA